MYTFSLAKHTEKTTLSFTFNSICRQHLLFELYFLFASSLCPWLCNPKDMPYSAPVNHGQSVDRWKCVDTALPHITQTYMYMYMYVGYYCKYYTYDVHCIRSINRGNWTRWKLCTCNIHVQCERISSYKLFRLGVSERDWTVYQNRGK